MSVDFVYFRFKRDKQCKEDEDGNNSSDQGSADSTIKEENDLSTSPPPSTSHHVTQGTHTAPPPSHGVPASHGAPEQPLREQQINTTMYDNTDSHKTHDYTATYRPPYYTQEGAGNVYNNTSSHDNYVATSYPTNSQYIATNPQPSYSRSQETTSSASPTSSTEYNSKQQQQPDLYQQHLDNHSTVTSYSSDVTDKTGYWYAPPNVRTAANYNAYPGLSDSFYPKSNIIPY